MGFRFRQGIRIFPGLRLNLSKSGVSASLGGPGATLNLSKKGVRGTVGLPGSGVSYSDMLYRVGKAGSRRPSEKGDLPAEPQTGGPLNSDLGDSDAYNELYLLTVYLVVANGNASRSWLQRQLQISYKDAAELIEQMEGDGIVSSADRVGRRKVLVAITDLPELPDHLLND